ncbi:unnamed protein product [Caenorhabditis bovis]|uniref:Potassium channel domain-containing protein n=1 Tax=Caenorhabditis bovis TaxID=2654633 RepID=A0A8S1EUX6_9PELO|nr:unnamed protein product [Caenorhabditis bovis]
MAMFIRHTSPTTTVLADGYTDDALGSKYDNYRASRPYSRESLLSGGTSLGSRVRLSQFSLLSRPDATLAEGEDDDDDDGDEREDDTSNIHYRVQKNRLQAKVFEMLAGQFSRAGSLEMPEECASEKAAAVALQPPPKSILGKCKYYYDKYKLHRTSACVCLILYSFFGAWLFYLVEHDYEKEVKGKEKIDLWNLRNDTFQKMIAVIHHRRGAHFNFEEIFIEYEKRLLKVRLPECLDWDYWGALFYVGTLFTTIGYGNIAPRTMAGRALSVIYAIIGIPLVLAILSKCGKWLTTTLSIYWQQHCRRIKVKAQKTTNRLRGRKAIFDTLESGIIGDLGVDEIESRTIPIWLALLICVLFVCACSSLFLIWETRWTFFTSLYFFCISLSTIGLGDIVPDHPHMFIIMFVLVIIGLSIVSMLISVIQIKMEEWLYHLIKKIQQEYNRALENGENVDREAVLRNVMTNEPAWMQLMAPTMLTGQQNDKLEQKVEQFERILKDSKDVQTDLSVAFAGTQVERFEQSMACDPMSDRARPQHCGTQWTAQHENDESRSNDFRDSISDATSLPIDSVSVQQHNEQQQRRAAAHTHKFVEGAAQTDLAQFQIDEIAMKLASLQNQRVRPPIVERSMATSAYMDSPQDSQSDELLLQKAFSQAELDILCQAMIKSDYEKRKLVDCAVSADRRDDFEDKSLNTSLSLTPEEILKRIKPMRSACTSPQRSMDARSACNSAQHSLSIDIGKPAARSAANSAQNSLAIDLKHAFISAQNSLAVDPEDRETQTTIREHADMSTDPISPMFRKDVETEMSISEKPAARDQNTSPIVKHHDSTEYDDRSMQTSIAEFIGKLFQKNDQSQQTSISEDLKKKKKKKSKKKNGDDEMSSSSSDKLSEETGSDRGIPNAMVSSVSMSTQYSPPPGFPDSSRLSEPCRGRSLSTSGVGTSIFEDETRQEVIVQTDDSYLKIARRLDEYRNNKTQFLPVCAASPLSSKEVEPFKTDRPSERSCYYFGANMTRRLSLGRSRRKSKNSRDTQTGQSMDSEMLHEVLTNEKSRSISPKRPSSRGVLQRNPSLPTGISRGKVSNYVHQHEKGIHNPATNRMSPVKIIRQYSLEHDPS